MTSTLCRIGRAIDMGQAPTFIHTDDMSVCDHGRELPTIDHLYVYFTQRTEPGEQYAVSAAFSGAGSVTLALFGQASDAREWAQTRAAAMSWGLSILPSAE